jgi:hypothetical protein
MFDNAQYQVPDWTGSNIAIFEMKIDLATANLPMLDIVSFPIAKNYPVEA